MNQDFSIASIATPLHGSRDSPDSGGEGTGLSNGETTVPWMLNIFTIIITTYR